MPVDAKANMGGHDVKAKVGTITAATIEGNAIHIEGFFYAADFPSRGQADPVRARHDLGFSWEIQNIFVEDIYRRPAGNHGLRLHRGCDPLQGQGRLHNHITGRAGRGELHV